MRDVYLVLFCLQICLLVYGPVAAGGAKARHCREASRTLTTSQGNAAKPGAEGAAVRASRPLTRQTPLVELDTRRRRHRARADTGCRVLQHLSYLWTRAHLY
jgi:hypothetical protein